MSDELKPSKCPWGCAPVPIGVRLRTGELTYGCSHTGSLGLTIEEWNTRPADQQQSARIAELEQKLSNANRDSINDLECVQGYCKRLGIPFEGSIYGVPGITELAEAITLKCEHYKSEAERLESELATLRPLAELCGEMAEVINFLRDDFGHFSNGSIKMAADVIAKFRALQPEKPE